MDVQQVMRQNYDEMRNLREQNEAMHGDVRAIKELLRATNTSLPFQLQEGGGSPDVLASSPQPGPGYVRHIQGQSSNVAPKGPGRMVGANISKNSASENRKAYNGGAPVPPQRESTHFALKSITGRAAGSGGGTGSNNIQQNGVDSSGYYSSNSTARLSSEVNRSRAATAKLTAQMPSYITRSSNGTSNGVDGRTLPAICSLKDGVPAARQPSGRGRPIVRKGSAIAKK